MGKGFDFIQEDERLVHGDYEVDGFEIYWRRVPDNVRSRIVKKHTKYHRKRGEVTDWDAVGRDVLEYMITGWRGGYHKVDGKRVELEYAIENISKIPGDLLGDLIDLSGINNTDDQEEDRKNSESTSDSNPSMTV